jgi:outer membrane protein assembly factor BamB
VYALSQGEGKLQVLELSEGKTIFELDMPSTDVPAIMVDGTLYVATERGTLHAIDSRRQEELWNVELRSRPVAGPLVVDRGVAYFTRDSLHLLDASTGRRIGSRPVHDRIAGEAASDGRRIFVGTEAGSIRAWSIERLEPLWATSGFDTFRSGPALDDDAGYLVTRSGDLVRFDTDNGSARILARLPGAAVGPPTLVRNGILVGTLQGELVFVDRNGNTHWQVDLEGSVEGPVYVHAGRVIVPMYGPVGGPLGTKPLRGKITELR